ncbi:MAG: anaerobic ribonucleoside-triphosphate reductase activating protein [Christensenellaceae bacterium]|nr:anaerobic ribonucleoside-triphosphate reductase activating protein [Christensenellaceae bacterium]
MESNHFSQDNMLRVAGIVNDSVTDGPGIRYSLFLQGCPHACIGCHNPESIPVEGGTLMSVSEIFNAIKQNPLLTGVTFTGGEPLLQAKALNQLAEKIKGLNLELSIYTGFLYEDIQKLGPDATRLISYADIIVDGPFVKNQKSLELKFKGSKNQRVINVKKTLENNNIVVLDSSGRWE